MSEQPNALDHLRIALFHARQAVERFEEGSRGESVAENTEAWANRSVVIAEREVTNNE